jgi:Flp pilus assembly protein TadG
MTRRQRRRGRGEGQILVLFTLVLIVLMGIAALVIDVGVLRRANQELWNATDAGALAGAEELPMDATRAATVGRRFATTNFPGVNPSDIVVSYRCVVGDRNNDGMPDASDIPSVCDPGPSAGGSWRCANGICAAPCVPTQVNVTCNTLVLSSAVAVNYTFGRALGVNSGSTQQVLSAACVGPCGAAPSVQVDLVLIVDRTSSMSTADIQNARDASNSVLKLYDPDLQHIAFGILGPSSTTSSCGGANAPAQGVAAATTTGSVTWLPVGLTGVGAPVNERYLNTNGTINTSSKLAKTIACFNQSSTGTIMTNPLTTARQYLVANARPGAVKGIIFMTDGQPNGDTCLAADSAATAAKAAGIEIFTVGFGIEAFTCPDTSGTWKNKSVTTFLASMATGSSDNGCDDVENGDGDHYFCQPRTDSLTTVFKTAATALARGTRLISLP